MTRLRPLAAVLALLAMAAGCTSDGGGDHPAGPPSPLASCDRLTEPLAGPSAPPAGGVGEPLPQLTLPCLTGGAPFRLAELRGPAVVNLWASWCAPCRAELPELQRYADQVAGQVRVLGVVTGDRRSAAVALATDLGIRFPAVDDPDERVRAALGAAGLPVTLFVDAAGRVRHVHRTGALDQPELVRLAGEHLGVAT